MKKMKKILGFLILGWAFSFNLALAVLDCPKGLINDPAPGKCGRYVDVNQDEICDHSQDLTIPEDEVALLNDYGTATVTPSTVPAVLAVNNQDLSQNQVQNQIQGGQQHGKISKKYYITEITVFFVLLYVVSLVLVKKEIIADVKNRQFWNFLLLISFVLTILSSVSLLLNYGYGIGNGGDTFWHIEFGYAMILISLFHTLWHIPYYRCFFSRQKREECPE